MDLNCDGTQVLVNSTQSTIDNNVLTMNTPHMITPRLFDEGAVAAQDQFVPNTFSAPELVGSISTSSNIEKLSVDNDLSSARVSACEVYFKIQFAGLSLGETVRLSRMSFSIAYDSTSSLLKEAQEFHYQSSGPMGIKALMPKLETVADKTTRNGSR